MAMQRDMRIESLLLDAPPAPPANVLICNNRPRKCRSMQWYKALPILPSMVRPSQLTSVGLVLMLAAATHSVSAQQTPAKAVQPGGISLGRETTAQPDS